MNILKFAIPIGISLVVVFVTTGHLLKDDAVLLEKNTPIANTTSIVFKQSDLTLRDSIVNFGKEYLGTPYVTGGCSKAGFDCSGFAYFVYQHFKIKVPRSSADYKNFGKEIPLDSVKKGDILLFLSPTRNVIGHLGIVTNPNGMETEFIHSTSGRDMKVIISSLKIQGYARRFVKAVDILENP